MNDDGRKYAENKIYSMKEKFYAKRRKPVDRNFFIAFVVFIILFYCYLKGYFINLDSFIKGIFS